MPDDLSALQSWRRSHQQFGGLAGRHFEYEFWRGDLCLYVGATSNIFGRLRHHERRFGGLVAEVRVSEHASRWAAEVAESAAIRDLQPLFNQAGRDTA